MNGSVDVKFDNVNVISKAQGRVNDATVAEINNVWSRPGDNYKTDGAYDQAINTLNTATMYDAPTKTCAVTCHNEKTSTWGESNVSCFYCHADLPETPNP